MDNTAADLAAVIVFISFIAAALVLISACIEERERDKEQAKKSARNRQ